MSAPFVVIGAGVAGCVAARTLTDAGHEVVLLEDGPGPVRPAELEHLDHLGTAAAHDWWYPDPPRRGRGSGGSSAVNGMVLDAIDPLDRRRWGWGDEPDHRMSADEAWVLAQWSHTEVESGPFTTVFGECVTRGFPRTDPTALSGAQGWRPLSLAWADGQRVSAADAFLDDAADVRYGTEVAAIDGSTVTTTAGERIDATHILVAAGAVGSPRLLVASGLVEGERLAPPLNHASTAIIVELDRSLRVEPGIDHPPSSRLLRTATGLSENTVDLQILVLDHTGTDTAGRAHAAVIVSALEPDRQKVLVAGITQVLHWLREIDGVIKVSISDDQVPVQHHCCTLIDLPAPRGPVTVVDASVLPALPHTNPMVCVATGARRQTLELLSPGRR
jgi:glycine/D-amino acid oxidase-like deaminating enzyme